MFDLKVLGKTKVLFDDAASSLFVEGADSDFELLSFHSPLVGIIDKGYIVINNKYKIKAAGGIVSFCENKCLVMVEEI